MHKQSHYPIPYLPILFLIIAIFIQIRSVNSYYFHTDRNILFAYGYLSILALSKEKQTKVPSTTYFVCKEVHSLFSKQLLCSNLVRNAHIKIKGGVLLFHNSHLQSIHLPFAFTLINRSLYLTLGRFLKVHT